MNRLEDSMGTENSVFDIWRYDIIVLPHIGYNNNNNNNIAFFPKQVGVG